MSKSTQTNKPVAAQSVKASNHLPTANQQPPLILPHVSPNQGSSKDVAGARSFVTQTWTIPDRPKPGRKPKQKPCPASKQQVHQSQQGTLHIDCPIVSAPVKSKPPLITQHEPAKTTKDLDTITSPGALQQAYINSLEAKIQSLQSQESEQVNYYKTLASQSTAKIDKIQSDNNILQSQITILRGEVLRLRKRISQLNKKPTIETQQQPIVVEDDSPPKEAKVRKQVSHPDADSPCSLERTGTSLKKPRRPSVHDHINEPQPSAVAVPERFDPPQVPSQFSLPENTTTAISGSNNISHKRVPDFTSSDIYCGLCTSELDCVCRQVGLKPPLQTASLPVKDLEKNPLAVPIRRRAQPSTSSVWRIVSAHDSVTPLTASPKMMESVPTRECSGNPKDCPACCDDPFGQAFCTALNQATATQESGSRSEGTVGSPVGVGSTTTRKVQRSDPIVDAYMSIPCCGDPELCGSQNCFDNAPSPSAVEKEMKVSCSEAWRQLKAHPNIGLANLQLLADVVARKSTPNSSYSSVEPNSSSLHYHHHSQSHERDSNSSWPSSHSMLENEDSIFSPHVTLSTVFENTHSDFDEDSQHHYGQGENPTLRGSCQSSKDSLQDEHQLPIHPHQQHHSVTSNTHPSSSNKKVKFVEKQSLEQALRMLDRAI